MARLILHYFYDPLCGWCYAAEPLIQAAAAAGVPIMLHGGGLWERPVHAPEAKRRMMRCAPINLPRQQGDGERADRVCCTGAGGV